MSGPEHDTERAAAMGNHTGYDVIAARMNLIAELDVARTWSRGNAEFELVFMFPAVTAALALYGGSLSATGWNRKTGGPDKARLGLHGVSVEGAGITTAIIAWMEAARQSLAGVET